ncbi:MAG: hypothetical protein AAF530_21595 [Pseudomonadota bacterium]
MEKQSKIAVGQSTTISGKQKHAPITSDFLADPLCCLAAFFTFTFSAIIDLEVLAQFFPNHFFLFT